MSNAKTVFAARHAQLIKAGMSFIYEQHKNDLINNPIQALSTFTNLPDFVPGTMVAGSVNNIVGRKHDFILIVAKAGKAVLFSTEELNGVVFMVDKEWSGNASHLEFIKKAQADIDADLTESEEVVQHFFDIADSYKKPEAVVNADAEPESAMGAFNRAYYNSPEIRYSDKWASATGYYDNAVDGGDHPRLAAGQVVRALSPLPNDRRLIIVGTCFGNVVLFERFTGGKSGVITKNWSTHFSRAMGSMFGSGAMSHDDIVKLAGDPTQYDHVNIGQFMANMERVLKSYKDHVAKYYTE